MSPPLKHFSRRPRHFGKLNGVAIDAGVLGHELGTEPIWQTSQEEYHLIMDVNVRGIFNVLTVSLYLGFLEDGSSVVHIGSMFFSSRLQKWRCLCSIKACCSGYGEKRGQRNGC